MKTFLRENLMIVVSVALPLLVAVFFVLASILPGLYATPPAHDLLLTLYGRTTASQSQLQVEFVVENGHVKVLALKPGEPHYMDNPRLFRYEHRSGNVREIIIPLPENIDELENKTEIHVAELAGLKVNAALRAPDGYEFRGRRRGGGLMTELFGGTRHSSDVSIARDGAIIKIKLPASDYWYNDIRFLGWVVE